MDLDAILDGTVTETAIDKPTQPTTTAVATVDPISGELMDPKTEGEDERRMEEDFVFSRGALKTIAVEAQTAMNRASEVAQQTDNAMAFKSLAELIRATIEVHRELQDLHRTAAEVRSVVAVAKTPPGTVNVDKAIVFSGTPEEFLKMLSPDRT